MNKGRIISIAKTMLIAALFLALMITSSNARWEKEEAYNAYLVDREAQYGARYGHPEITEEIKESFNSAVIPAFMSGAKEIMNGLTDPVEALSQSDAGELALTIYRNFGY